MAYETFVPKRARPKVIYLVKQRKWRCQACNRLFPRRLRKTAKAHAAICEG